MDKEHIKELLKALVGAHEEGDSGALLLQINLKKTVKNLISDILKGEHLEKQISKKQIKQIYAIMGDYDVYPTCPLCGEKIKINSDILKHSEQTQPMTFTWDHIKPKSMGGPDGLMNMQPTHKICNNKKADKILYDKHYRIEVTARFEIYCENEEKPKSKSGGSNLRKQDCWCHKQKCQRRK